MIYKTLGNTGLLVSHLGLGTMTFGRGEGICGAISGSDQSSADELAQCAVESGVNFFDTSNSGGTTLKCDIFFRLFRL